MPSQHAAHFDASGWARGRRASLAVVIAASGLLLGGAASAPDADAACMPPVVKVTPRAAQPGGNVLITGQGWKEGCNDTVNCSDNGPCPRDPSAPPRTGIALRFSQGRDSDALGEVDADDFGRFSVSAVVPTWARRGAATITADDVITGFMVGNLRGNGVASGVLTSEELAARLGTGSGGGATSGGEPHPRTGAEGGPLLALVLAAAATLTRRLTR